jgi:hypothetical protein
MKGVAKGNCDMRDLVSSEPAMHAEKQRPERSLDDQLTDGYARALAIEADCAATLRRIGDLSADASGETASSELHELAASLGAKRSELAILRTRLDNLRRSADPPGRLY